MSETPPQPVEEEKPKHPRVGTAYQADVVPWEQQQRPTPAELAEQAHTSSECVWDGRRVTAEGLARYLAAADAACARVGVPPICVCGGSVRYGIERALDVLAQRYGYDVDAAVAALGSAAAAGDAAAVKDAVLWAPGDEWRWDAGDERLFAYAYRRFGFDLIELARFLPEHRAAQIQHFYYAWKRTKRYYDAVYRPAKKRVRR